MNWIEYVGLTPAGCLPCCNSNVPPPAACACALEIPPFANIYSNYALANTAVSTQVNNCFLYSSPSANSLIGTYTTTVINAAANIAADTQYIWACISAGSTTQLNVDYTTTGTNGNTSTNANVSFIIHACANTIVSTNSNVPNANIWPSGNFVVSIANAGTYYLEMYLKGLAGAVATNTTWGITSNTNIVLNPVIALWDDSGTTRQLEACPKMLLPPLTESTGDWYASCAAANSIISSPQVNNCVAFIASNIGSDFTAIDGGTYLSTAGNNTITAPNIWGSFNSNAGSDVLLSVGGAYSNLPPTATYSASIYDYSGAVIAEDVALGFPYEIYANNVAYTGRYIFRVSGGGGNQLAIATNITSSNGFSANPIQALYDVGLTCPARLNCNTNCP